MRQSIQIAVVAAIFPLAALATPAYAGLQAFLSVTPGSPASTQCPTAGATCVYGPPAGSIITFSPEPFTFNGALINGELIAASGVPGALGVDSLDTSALAVINETNTIEAVTIIVSDIDYAGPVTNAELAGSGTFEATVGSSITFKWWADPTNTQGASTSGNTPGTLLDSFNTTATGVVQSFSINDSVPFSAAGPFSMTEEATYTLQPHGELLNRGLGMVITEVPKSSTWVMMLLGFAGLGFAAHRSSRTRIALVD